MLETIPLKDPDRGRRFAMATLCLVLMCILCARMEAQNTRNAQIVFSPKAELKEGQADQSLIIWVRRFVATGDAMSRLNQNGTRELGAAIREAIEQSDAYREGRLKLTILLSGDPNKILSADTELGSGASASREIRTQRPESTLNYKYLVDASYYLEGGSSANRVKVDARVLRHDTGLEMLSASDDFDARKELGDPLARLGWKLATKLLKSEGLPEPKRYSLTVPCISIKSGDKPEIASLSAVARSYVSQELAESRFLNIDLDVPDCTNQEAGSKAKAGFDLKIIITTVHDAASGLESDLNIGLEVYYEKGYLTGINKECHASDLVGTAQDVTKDLREKLPGVIREKL